MSGEPVSDEKWRELLDGLVVQQAIIAEWPPEATCPEAERCEFSRHRTLAHLRAAQETWQEAVQLFAVNDKLSILRPHPWRLFKDLGYELVAWEEHKSKFLGDRQKWIELVSDPSLDRNRGGRLSGKPRMIASLTELLVNHEKHHLVQLEVRAARNAKLRK
ncbi:MAG TPA: hypothetical protein VK171_17040 [Fimbriimonas sp.]|nr:hypothetical protein [Fimbriimonas sp.]